MKTNQDRLVWVVEKFLAKPIEPIEEDTRRRAKGAFQRVWIREFLTLRRSSILTNTDEDPREMSDAELRELHGDAAAALALFVDGEGLMTRISVEKRLLQPSRASTGKRQAPVLLVTGRVRDVFLEVLYHLLASVPADQVRRCPGCRTIFVRRGRQTHCSSKCYDRAYWENLPAKTVERYRRTQYSAMGWTRGARTSK